MDLLQQVNVAFDAEACRPDPTPRPARREVGYGRIGPQDRRQVGLGLIQRLRSSKSICAAWASVKPSFPVGMLTAPRFPSAVAMKPVGLADRPTEPAASSVPPTEGPVSADAPLASIAACWSCWRMVLICGLQFSTSKIPGGGRNPPPPPPPPPKAIRGPPGGHLRPGMLKPAAKPL